MRAFKRLCAAVTVLFAALVLCLNISIAKNESNIDGLYRVEAKRLADDINDTGSYDLAEYPHITGVFSETDGELFTSEEHYLIIEAGGTLYRVEYEIDGNDNNVLAINLVMAGIFLLFAALMYYFWRNIISPFGRLNNVPKELARGNLAVPIPEEKSRFFGKFTWGVNLLRESIEKSRKNEITMQKDKKLLLLSLSHDIKTPLSAIKLNAKAIEKDLYHDEEKRRNAARNISSRADEIESFVSQITKAASEDFMSFEVKPGEEFLSVIIARITARYTSQLAVTGTEFAVGQYSDRLLSCDPDRLAECLQNLIENAIKYGDGRQIALSFDIIDGCELITVSNTGCTLEPKELTQIFESFHRGNNSENVQGNGLGLFICRKLIGLMNGDVFADIKDGSFCVTLVVRLA